jgi:hypothetical protein
VYFVDQRAERYERRSVILTTNLVFSEWDRIFKDPMTTMAAIDRVVHHSVILDLMAIESYRAREAHQQHQATLDETPRHTTQRPPGGEKGETAQMEGSRPRNGDPQVGVTDPLPGGLAHE